MQGKGNVVETVKNFLNNHKEIGVGGAIRKYYVGERKNCYLIKLRE